MKRKVFIMISLLITILALSSCSKKITVTFNYIYKTEEVTVKKGKTVEKPIDPIREGYTFQKWTYRGQPYDFSQKVKENITLFAEYTKNKEPITYLDAPQNVKCNNSIISFDEVKNATSYKVIIGDEVYETKTNSFNATKILNDCGFAFVSVIACNDKVESVESEIILAEKNFTEDEIEIILDIKGSIPTDPNIVATLNDYAVAVKKYNFTLDEFNSISDFSQLIEENRFGDYIGAYIFITNANMKYAYVQLGFLEKPVYQYEMQELFDDMIEKKVYTSSYKKALEDEMFANLIVGYLGYFSYLVKVKPENYKTIYEYLENLSSVTVNNINPLSFEIRKENEQITFISKVDKKEYKLTNEEFMNIMNYYYQYKEKTSTSSTREKIYKVEKAYGEYLYNLAYYNQIKELDSKIRETEIKFIYSLEKNKDTFNQTLKDIYNLVLDIQDGKFNELIEIINEIIDGNTSITNVTNLKNELIEALSILQNIFKSKENIDIVLEIFENAAVLFNEIGDSSFVLLKSEINLVIELLNKLEETLNEINPTDLQAALNLINNPNDQIAIDAAKEIIELFRNNFSKIEYDEPDTNVLIYHYDLLIKQYLGENYKSLLSIKYGLKFTEEEYDQFSQELNKFFDYISEYENINQITDLLTNIIYNKDLNFDELSNKNEIIDFINYILNYFNKEKCDEYSYYIKSYLSSIYRDYDYDLNEYYNELSNNFSVILKKYLVDSLIENLMQFTDETTEEKLDILESTLKIVKEFFTNDEMKQYIESSNKLDNILNNKNNNLQYSELYNDYSSSIDKLISLIGEYDIALKDDETKLINDLRKLYKDINWVYPEWLTIEVDLENRCVNFKLKDDLVEKVSDIKIISYGGFDLELLRTNLSSTFVLRNYEIIPEIKDTMLTFSFETITNILENNMFTKINEENMNRFKTGEYNLSIEFKENKKFITVSVNGKNIVYANVLSLAYSKLLGEYAEIIFNKTE